MAAKNSLGKFDGAYDVLGDRGGVIDSALLQHVADDVFELLWFHGNSLS
jgi:hypothetical protein